MNKKTASAIINAARDEYQKRGYPTTGIDQIIKTANVSKAEFDEQFSSLEDCGLKVLKYHAQELKRTFKKYDENDNCRQRLSLFLDDLYEDAETLAKEGHPIFNLYYDVRNMDNGLSQAAAETLE